MDQDKPAITLNTQNGCGESPLDRTWFTEHGIPVVERNVTGDEAGALAATETFATPLLVVGQHRVLGYRPDVLWAAINTEGTQ